MNFYKRYPADYQRKTSRLTLAQHGAYTLLLDELYTLEEPLPAEMEEIYRICRAMNKAEQEAVRVVTDRFFPIGEDGMRHNKRGSEELAEAAPAVQAARENGRKGGRPKKPSDNPLGFQNTNPTGNPLGFQKQTHKEPSSKPPQSLELRENLNPSKLSLAPTRPLDDRPPLELGQAPPSATKSLPDCPHLDVLALWAEVLPALPQHMPDHWRGTRADHLRARWRETAAAKNWTEKADGISFLRKLFSYVGQSHFLTGQAKPMPGKRPFVIELEWLVMPLNWAKVIEGKFHQEAA